MTVLTEQETSVSVSTRPWLGAGHGFSVFLTYIMSQSVIIFLISFFVAFIMGLLGLWKTQGESTINMLMPWMALVGTIGACLLAIKVTAWFARRSGEEEWEQAIGWLPVKRSALTFGVMSGLGLSLLYLVLASLWFPPPTDLVDNPINKMLASSGVLLIMACVLMVGIAPIVEEYVFRGVMYKGFEQSWGPVPAACLVTTLFVLMHVPQTQYYPFAWSTLACLSLLTVWLRIRTHSIFPAIACHMAYNGTLVGLALLARSVSHIS